MTLRASAILAILTTLGVAACGDRYTRPGGAGGPVPSGNVPVYRIAAGAGTVVQPGEQSGYGIAANTGGSYRLIWTGDSRQSGTYREFYGSVYTPGRFDRVVRGCDGSVCGLERGDILSSPVATQGGERVDFDAFAYDSLDGFDFVVDTEPVYFDLYIDGQRFPQLLFFPAINPSTNQTYIANVDTFPFGLTTQ